MKPRSTRAIIEAAILGLVAFIIIRFFAAAPTPYDYFARLANAFSKGRLYLTEAPPWLNELIPAGQNRYYVPYPPWPALLIAPFVILGRPLNQTLLANILGALNVSLSFLLTHLLTRKQTRSRLRLTALSSLMAIFLGLTTPNFFLASVGSAWYLSHVVATTFLLLAALSALSSQALVSGICLGAAYWSRLPTILTAPLLLALLLKRDQPRSTGKRPKTRSRTWLQTTIVFSLGVGVFIGLNSLYNWLRFGVPWDIGYTLIPNVLSESWFQKGIFHPSYLKRHLEILFLSLPKKTNTFPFLIPSWGGTAIWLTTPVIILTPLATPKNILNLVAWLTLVLTALPSLFHGTTGFSQFGYRFAMDSVLPLFFLVYQGIARVPRPLAWLLVLLGVAVNLWGTFLINRLDLVGW